MKTRAKRIANVASIVWTPKQMRGVTMRTLLWTHYYKSLQKWRGKVDNSFEFFLNYRILIPKSIISTKWKGEFVTLSILSSFHISYLHVNKKENLIFPFHFHFLSLLSNITFGWHWSCVLVCFLIFFKQVSVICLIF